MKPRQWTARLALAGGVAALAWALSPAGGSAVQPSFRPATRSALASYLQQPSAASWASQTGGSRSHLPNSVMPNSTVGVRCSVDTTDAGTPPSCSTSSATVRCSAHCDNVQFCSAVIGTAPSGPAAICSTLGGSNGLTCSVLQPVLTSAGPSQCSTFGGLPGITLACSIMGVAGQQACSARNPAGIAGNQCSTFTGGTTGGARRCSVLLGGTPLNNRCSVGDSVPVGSVPKECSVFTPNSKCSVQSGNNGFCTVFAPAPAGTCSIFAASATCSVIGGASGSFCTWP
ncbi:MAG: hypothetical protein EYC70_12230 [Planctomycetota bacterium]|nr:MAG: hypothetical protein EYC70_12230 [Planctomycetota bacterium]